MLYTGDKLSSSIFCEASVTPDQISTFSNMCFAHLLNKILHWNENDRHINSFYGYDLSIIW